MKTYKVYSCGYLLKVIGTNDIAAFFEMMLNIYTLIKITDINDNIVYTGGSF